MSEDARIVISSDIETGDTIKFGSYEQDNNPDNGKEPISWIVLDKTDEYMMLITKNCINCVKFNDVYENTDWELCTLRQWLNNDFYEDAFNKGEKEIILETELTTNNNSTYGTNSGSNTVNKVYILSMNEASKYFTADSKRVSKSTQYAQSNGIWAEADKETSWWWLRTSGGNSKYASCVNHEGKIVESGSSVNTTDNGVRPVICIEY